MKMRALGATGLNVSEIGLGGGPLGGAMIDDAGAVQLICDGIELGINIIDTAPSYGRSETRIGLAMRGRRDAIVLSTKLGYGVPGIPDWTGPCITAGIDAALRRLGTTWLDIAHLHSCPLDVLVRGEVIDALEAAVRAGKVRVAAYSGDGDPLDWAIESGRFGVVQCSVNLADQRALDGAIPRANERGIGVFAKRPLANGVWRYSQRPVAVDVGEYWARLQAMAMQAATPDVALRFVLAQPIASALVGTTNGGHLAAAVDAAAAGSLAAATVLHARDAFRRCDHGWHGIV